MTETQHWQRVYQDRDPERVSWYEAESKSSLAAIEAAGVNSNGAVIDIGGGASPLAGSLATQGFGDVTVADISESAIAESKRRNDAEANGIDWVVADVRSHDFGRRFDLWHDRAVFHFMVDPADRRGYIETMKRSLGPGGNAVIATFGPEGPTECSGLPVNRYSAELLARVLGEEFQLMDSELQVHRTPSGKEQQFLWARFERH